MPLQTWLLNSNTRGIQDLLKQALGQSLAFTPGGVLLAAAKPILENKNVQDILNATGPGNPIDDALLAGSRALHNVDTVSPLLGMVSAPTLRKYWNDLYKLDEAGAPIIRRGEPVKGLNEIEDVLRKRAALNRLHGDEAENVVLQGRAAVEDVLKPSNPMTAPEGMDEWEWLKRIAQEGVNKAVGLDKRTIDITATDDVGKTLAGMENVAQATPTIEQTLIHNQNIDPRVAAEIEKAQALDDIILNPTLRGLMNARANNLKSIGQFQNAIKEQGVDISRSSAAYLRNTDARSNWLDPITKPMEKNKSIEQLNINQLMERLRSVKQITKVNSKITNTPGPGAYKSGFDYRTTVQEMLANNEIDKRQADSLNRLFGGHSPSHVVKGLTGKAQSELDDELVRDKAIELNNLVNKALFRIRKKE